MRVSALLGSVVLAGLTGIMWLVDHTGQETPWLVAIGLTAFFTAACWAELFWTKGVYDDRNIRFQSIWKARRCLDWSQLDRVEFNPGMDWHVLYFGDGQKILISKYMKGHREVLTLARSMGHLF